ncbi:MAG: hypothetical protein JXB46_07640, partial [Candidatus Eisenbacteria bacterium]|nr:hypothetical protein [Candidatus Eisenbacteria bacterium]
MRHASNSGFLKGVGEIRSDILIPRYYDPRLAEECGRLRQDHTPISLDELKERGQLRHDHGNYVPKMTYGTGPYPYIRTSDLANWELRASPKHGVAREVFEQYQASQDVRAEDILFVHEGTYLIGSAALVTSFDGPMLYQHHLAKFRLENGAPCGPYFLLAALQSRFVGQQVRARQFSADIIDSVVGRLGEVVIGIPKRGGDVSRIDAQMRDAILTRAKIREKLSYVMRELDVWMRGGERAGLSRIFEWEPSADVYQGRPAFLGGRGDFKAFTRPAKQLVGDVLTPRYYDPEAAELAPAYSRLCRLEDVRRLVVERLLALDTGDEVGKISYGTGRIPFFRTSDLGSYELKQDPKQGVSREIWEEWQQDQDVCVNDILLVRDGTYLVGTSVMVSDSDLPCLYCGGLIKIRCLDWDRCPPGLLYALLNAPYVRKQMRNKQFTRDVIDTLGRRFLEVLLPIPRDGGVRREIAGAV